MKFSNWIDSLISEKNLDLEGEIITSWGCVTLGFVVEHIKIAPKHEQEKIKHILVKIDFHNGDVMHFFKHLAEALREQASQYIAIC